MAAVLENPPMIDPSRSAKIPVTLGSAFRGSGGPADQRNFKPHLQLNQAAKIQSSRRPADSRINLTIKEPDDNGEYRYTGTQQPSGSCALIYDPSTKSLVLEKLDVDFNFNLQNTPTNHDRSHITSQYPQLDTGISDVESDGGSNADVPTVNGVEHSEADANNPYDYRHFLKRRRSSSPEAPVSRPSLSPAVAPRRPSRSNIKPKPRPRPQQRPNRPTREEPKANSDDSDDGGLTIDMGDSPPPRRFGSGAVVFNHDKRNGPISLRSAASSMSPASIRHDSGNEEAESDNDVEHLKLPSPQRRPNPEEDEGDDEEDELVEDLMQAMESQDEEEEEGDVGGHNVDQTIRRTIEESSSESEEE
ncbi:MAG: hypothetical protein LQ338_002451 [Usnochroma carphineum]|nr:MAG: hypothetical protein LQ338_002451 [Usnochroma carphineum]